MIKPRELNGPTTLGDSNVNAQLLAQLIARRLWTRSLHRKMPKDGIEVAAPSITPAAAAEMRARQLLLRLLSPAQREEFQANGYFSVDVDRRGRFCILPSTLFNVLHVETGECYCGLPKAELPLCELMLSQKLMLENNPEQFFSVANRRPELDPNCVDRESRPHHVLQARITSRRRPVSWTEISMLPYTGHLP
jgi:hypothetical protein